MNAGGRLVTAGAVGRPHGLDGSFTVERVEHPLEAGTVVEVAGTERRVERRAGTDRRPLIRLEGVTDRESAVALRGELLLIETVLAEGEWLVDDLVGCTVPGLGVVQRIVGGSSCDVLELDGGVLVPLVSDAVERVDLEQRVITIDRHFLRLEEEA